jgi:hypothetical protein
VWLELTSIGILRDLENKVGLAAEKIFKAGLTEIVPQSLLPFQPLRLFL